jgi:hypothetical protein
VLDSCDYHPDHGDISVVEANTEFDFQINADLETNVDTGRIVASNESVIHVAQVDKLVMPVDSLVESSVGTGSDSHTAAQAGVHCAV